MTREFTVSKPDLSRARPLRWAWEGRILAGYLNLLVGDEGQGKSTFTAWLLAQLTRGTLPGCYRGRGVNVLIVGDEDAFDHVWTPRLEAAGADLDCVRRLDPHEDGPLDVTDDLLGLTHVVIEENIEFVVFDQLLDNLPAGLDGKVTKQVRDALHALKLWLHEMEIGVLATLHTNRTGSTNFRDVVQASQAFNAIARSSLLLAEHPEDPDRRVLARGKGNLSAPPRSFEFEIEPATVTNHHGPLSTSRISGICEGNLRAEDLLGASKQLTKADTGRRIIQDELADGPRPASEILQLLSEAGIDNSRAGKLANDLGVVKAKAGQFQPHAVWSLTGLPIVSALSDQSDHSDESWPVAA